MRTISKAIVNYDVLTVRRKLRGFCWPRQVQLIHIAGVTQNRQLYSLQVSSKYRSTTVTSAIVHVLTCGTFPYTCLVKRNKPTVHPSSGNSVRVWQIRLRFKHWKLVKFDYRQTFTVPIRRTPPSVAKYRRWWWGVANLPSFMDRRAEWG